MKKSKTIIIYVILMAFCIVGAIKLLSSDSNQPNVYGSSRYTLEEIMKRSAQIPSHEPIVGIGRGSDYYSATNDAIRNSGGLSKIIQDGDTVVIKPNLVRGEPAGSPVATDYRIVEAIVDIARKSGASRIIVAEASPVPNVFYGAGYDKLKNVELIDMNQYGVEDCYKLKPKKSLTGEAFYIPKIYMDADVVITVAKLKVHSATGVSLSLKNSVGVPPTNLYGQSGLGKLKLHSLGIDNVIVDLNKVRKPDFAVIDGIVGGELYGPIGCLKVESNIVLAGVDPIALDTVALNFMGFSTNQIYHVNLAASEGLGINDLNKIKVVGADLESIKMRFKEDVKWKHAQEAKKVVK